MERLVLAALCAMAGCDRGEDTSPKEPAGTTSESDMATTDEVDAAASSSSSGSGSSGTATGPECIDENDCEDPFYYDCVDGECVYVDPCGEWIVGEGGEMRGIRESGKIEVYPFEETANLYAITCRGARKAWVVGEGGTLLRTFDEGESWIEVESPTASTLRDVIASDWGPLYAAGDNGVILASANDGVTWSQLGSPPVDWTGVATTAIGDVAALAGADGSIWLLRGQDIARVVPNAEAPLHAISMTSDGDGIVAAGDEGLLVRSDDGGATWTTIPVDTLHSLFAVQISGSGDLVFATGQSGVFVRIDEGGTSVRTLLDPALALHDVHINHEGDGNVVGDLGLVFETHDAGLSWTPVDLGTARTLYSVDEVGHPHI